MKATIKNSIIFLLVVLSKSLSAQNVPIANAIPLIDSLRFVTASAGAQTSVVFHPVFQKYYSLRAGLTTYPLETWSVTGVPLAQTNAGVDSRGVWFNPNTGLIERNCFGSLGWATLNLDGAGNALNTFSMLFTGQRQPDVQSVGAYDYKTNTVLFNNSGVISVYNRTTGILNGTINLSGTNLANINIYSMIYTGETGFEIGILDYVSKTVLLFNRSTGVFSGSSQLPATAVTHSQFRFSYANNRVWLFNAATRTWKSYNIWNTPLPIELVSFTAKAVNNKLVLCNWTTASEINNDYFTLERSIDGRRFKTVGEIKGAGNSTELLNYSQSDSQPYQGISYYRLKQTDFNGDYSFSKIVAVTINESKGDLIVYPNPATDHIFISCPSLEGQKYAIKILDASGRVVMTKTLENEAPDHQIEINSSALKRGVYILQLLNDEKLEQIKIVFQ